MGKGVWAFAVSGTPGGNGCRQGTAIGKGNQMAGVEDVCTHLDNSQARFVARCVEGPSKLGDIMPMGFGDDGMMGDGRRWNDHGSSGSKRGQEGWVRVHPDAHDQYPAGGEATMGGPCQKMEIEKVDVRPSGGNRTPNTQTREGYRESRGRGRYVYSDSSLLESGNVGGACIVGTGEAESKVGCGKRRCGTAPAWPEA